MSKSKTTPDLAVIYFDVQDPRSQGWAYNVVGQSPDGQDDHESGPLDSRRRDAGLPTLLTQLRRHYRRSAVAIPSLAAWRRCQDGNGWEARATHARG